MLKRLQQTGDTIIEVALSMALLTSILLISWSITNRSTQISMAATERTEMVNKVKEQAEIAKAQWAKPGNQALFTNDSLYPKTIASEIKPNPCDELSGNQPKWYFTIDEATNTVTPATFNYNEGSVKNIWIQRIPDPSTPSAYTDLYIRACWFNNSGKVQKSESSQVIVRLNS